jgi:hypothetical protein
LRTIEDEPVENLLKPKQMEVKEKDGTCKLQLAAVDREEKQT